MIITLKRYAERFWLCEKCHMALAPHSIARTFLFNVEEDKGMDMPGKGTCDMCGQPRGEYDYAYECWLSRR